MSWCENKNFDSHLCLTIKKTPYQYKTQNGSRIVCINSVSKNVKHDNSKAIYLTDS